MMQGHAFSGKLLQSKPVLQPLLLTRRRLQAIVFPLLVACSGVAQSPHHPPATPASPTLAIHKTAGEVVVDLVVSDARGRIVKNLQPGELQVLDNNRPQKILSFRRVAAAVRLTPAELRRAGLPARLRPQPFNLVLLVFDRLGMSGRVLARQAAQQLVLRDLGPRDYVAVFGIDQTLVILRNFTRDHAAVLRAIAVATNAGSRGYRRLALRGRIMLLQVMDQMQAMQGQPTASNTQAIMQSLATGGDASTAPMSSPFERLSPLELILGNMMARSLLNVAAIKGAQRSWSSIAALDRLVQAIQPLAGRKEVVYFSQFLGVNASTSGVFHHLIRAANHAGVSFYPLDPQGLSLLSSGSQARDRLNYAAAISHGVNVASLNQKVSSAEAHEFDAVAGVQYAGRLSALSELAAETGGFLAARTNDFSASMRELAGDVHERYELTYVPASALNGAWHSISIRVPRHPGWRVRARSGYYALPRTPLPVAAYALPVLSLLQSQKPARDFPLRAAAYLFPQNPRRPTLALTASVPLSALAAFPAAAPRTYRVRVVVMQLVRNLRLRILRNFSKQYEWRVPSAALAGFRAKNLVVHHAVRLPPGDYVVQTAFYQPQNHAASILRQRLHVAATPPHALRLSSVVLVGSQAGLNSPPVRRSPLVLRRHNRFLRIYPSYRHLIPSGPANAIGIYFVAYVPRGLPPARLTVSFFRGDFPYSGLRLKLPSPSPGGRIPEILRIPARSFSPGAYVVKLRLRAGAKTARGSTHFSIFPSSGAH